MSRDVGIGLVLHADRGFLELTAPLLRDVDYLEVAPETLWRTDERDALRPNDYHRCILAIGAATGLPFVAHGTGLSLGALADDDAARQARWLHRIRRDHARFRFRWYTEHLGATRLGGVHLGLPCPIPMTTAHAAAVRGRLGALRDVVGTAGVENTAHHFCLGAPLDEPAFLAAATAEPGLGILLDLHNLYAMATNLGFDPEAYVARLPFARVVEIHLAGGGATESGWLPSGRTMVLDGHDRPVPEPVWRLLDRVLPYCRGLRGVTLERMEGTVEPSDVRGLRDELRRARSAVARARAAASDRPPAPPSAAEDTVATASAFERAYALALCGPDPVGGLAAIAAAGGGAAFAHADPDGVRLTAMLVAKLRFERLVNGSASAMRWFLADPAAFTAAFRSYHYDRPPVRHAPSREARDFHAWWERFRDRGVAAHA